MFRPPAIATSSLMKLPPPITISGCSHDGMTTVGCGNDAVSARTLSSVEETALAVEALAAGVEAGMACADHHFRKRLQCGLDWLIERTKSGTNFPPAPIGFYFAKLWYFEKMYPIVFAVAALGRALRATS